MANFEFDPRGLPKNFNKIDYYDKVETELISNYDVPKGDTITVAAIVGILLLGEYFDHTSRTFNGAIRVARDEMLKKVPAVDTAQLLQGVTSVDLVKQLKSFTKSELIGSLKIVPRSVYDGAFKKIISSKDGTERIGDLVKDMPRGKLNVLLNYLPDKVLADKLKTVALKDISAEIKASPPDQVFEMLQKATAAEISDVFSESTLAEIYGVLEEFPPNELTKVLSGILPINEKEVSSKKVYEKIAEIITKVAGKNAIFYQEFASVGRYVISRADEIPFGHPRFDRQVEIGLDQYISGAPVFDSLDLPPLTGEDGGDAEIIPDNIKAVSMVYASYQLDVGMRMIDVVDRINEIFHNGQLPIGFDAGGKAIDDYNWSAEDRLNIMARRMHYSRVLGMAGGDVSKEVQPNSQFDALFMRFLSSLAEYDRQQRVSDIVERLRPRNLTSEYVRKAGRDLASNLSLYGWASTQFAARRLRQHIEEALNILNQPSVQKSYGATNLYQVIERVSSLEFNSTPNIVKHRTMAEAGKQIIDLVAKYANVWNKSDGTPLFNEGDRVNLSDITDTDRDSFFSLTQQWLAVNGIKDAQVDKYAEPEISQYAPSIPSFGGYSSAMPKTNGGGNPDQMDRIKEMVSSGQMPSLDQLQGMFKM